MDFRIISVKELSEICKVSYSTAKKLRKDILRCYGKKVLTYELVRRYFMTDGA